MTTALGVCWAAAAPAQGTCALYLRDTFDRLGQVALAPSPEGFEAITELVQSRPRRCEPGSYSLFAGRYADLLQVLSTRWSDDAIRLAALARLLAPRRVPPDDYDAAFHAFLEARARLAAHLTAHSPELLEVFDGARPEPLVAQDTPTDREGIVQRVYEARRLMALGEVARADTSLAELIAALQAGATSPSATSAPTADAGMESAAETAPPKPRAEADAGAAPADGGA